MNHDNLDTSICGGYPGGSRWNPTKEQIDMLESLYKQGLRTPSAEQIQQIPYRLKAFGHIEVKNVFYWFQNHKARQRQKQKQDHVSYLNRFLHKSNSVLPPCPNVLCSPYDKVCGSMALYNQANQDCNATMHSFKSGEECMMNNPKQFNQETLDLFPLQPTGILQSRTAAASSSLPCTFFGNGNPIATPSTSSAPKSFSDQGFGGSNGSCDSR